MLPILGDSYRPSSQWTQELARKREALAALEPLDATTLAKISEHFITEQVYHNLRLGDIAIERERVRELARGDKPDNSSIPERTAASFANAVRHLYTLIANSSSKSQIMLTSDLLCELHALSMEGLGEGGGGFRKEAGKPLAPGHQPAFEDALPILVDNALDWFSVDSFNELHPVEQAWLVHLRLLDLQPFATANGRVARLASSLYTLRAELGPVIVSSEHREHYNQAVINSFQLITQPGIELFARALTRVIAEAVTIAGAKA